MGSEMCIRDRYTLLQYLPLFFQAVYLETPLKSSISILPFCCVVFVFTGIAAFAVDFFRKYLWEIWTGWVFLAVGCGIFSVWDQSSSTAMTAGFQVIAGIGIGTIFSVPPIPMQASAASDDQGLAMGIMVAFRLFGALIGLAVGATTCLLYTSDAADDMQCVDLGCRRIIKKKKKKNEFFFFKQKTAYFFFSSRRRHTR